MGTTARGRIGLALTLAATTLACDGATSPTNIGTPPALNLAGTWEGNIGPPQLATVAFRATWTASQTGSSVSGPIALFRPADNVTFAGTLTGTLSGTRLAASYTVPRGNISVAPDCSISGNGSLETSTTLIGGTLNVTYTNCQALTTTPSTVEDVRLVK